jgi:hypothetical protein
MLVGVREFLDKKQRVGRGPRRMCGDMYGCTPSSAAIAGLLTRGLADYAETVEVLTSLGYRERDIALDIFGFDLFRPILRAASSQAMRLSAEWNW